MKNRQQAEIHSPQKKGSIFFKKLSACATRTEWSSSSVCTAGERGIIIRKSSLLSIFQGVIKCMYKLFRSVAASTNNDPMIHKCPCVQHTHIYGLHGLLVMTMRPRGITYINCSQAFFTAMLFKTINEDKFWEQIMETQYTCVNASNPTSVFTCGIRI